MEKKIDINEVYDIKLMIYQMDEEMMHMSGLCPLCGTTATTIEDEKVR